MKQTRFTDILLLALLALGFLGIAKISYTSLLCRSRPHIAFIPICYVVLATYGMMIASIVIPNNGCNHYLFCVGWGVAFIIASVGSVAELVAGGGVYPTTSGGIRGVSGGSIPLCFASFAMLIVILVFFLIGPYKKTCKGAGRSLKLVLNILRSSMPERVQRTGC